MDTANPDKVNDNTNSPDTPENKEQQNLQTELNKNQQLLQSEINREHEREPKMNFLYRIVCWCSGARLYLLKQCPTDYNRFFGIGLVVIMTGVMASISGGFALYTVFQEPWIAIVFGLFWGTLIFALDWYIVSSLKKERKKGRELLHATPRLLLALLIALVISKPLELKLFEKEINQELVMMQSEQLEQYQESVAGQYAEVEELQETNNRLRAEILRKEQEQQALYQAIIAEAEGRSPTGRVGKGPVYKEKKQAYDRVLNELYTLRQKNGELIALNQSRIQALKDKRDQQVQRGEQATMNTDGFLARLHAISRMAQRDKAIALTNYFIILLFIFIESSPMIVKLLSKRGVYDMLLDYREYRAGEELERKYERVRFSKEDYHSYLQAIHKHRFGLQLDTDKRLIEKTFDAKEQVDDARIEKWREAQERDLHENSESYIQMIERIVDKDFTLYP
jgi:hypothetical protein